MSEAADVVKAAYGAFGRDDVAGILALVGEDADWQVYGPDSVPYMGQRRGVAGAASFFEALDRTAVFSEFAPQHFVDDGELVVVLGHEHYTVKATGRAVDNHFAHAFRIRGGKIVWFREYSNTDAVRWAYENDHRT